MSCEIQADSRITYPFLQFTADVTFTCAEDQMIGYPPRCPIENGLQVIKNLGFEDVSLWTNAVVLIGMLIAFRIIGYVALLGRARAKANV